MVSDILLVIVTALLVVVTGLLVKATKDSKESAEKQAQANTETSVMNIYFQAENDLRKTELQYNANPNPADISTAIIENTYLNYIKITDYVCIKYLHNEISTKVFKSYFYDVIINIYENRKYVFRHLEENVPYESYEKRHYMKIDFEDKNCYYSKIKEVYKKFKSIKESKPII